MEAHELKTTVSGLRTLGKNVSELSSLKRELISEAEYIKKHHPAPEKKAVRHLTVPSKQRLITKCAVFMAFLLIALGALLCTVLTYVKAGSYMSVWEEPGEEFDNYCAAYDSIKTVDELKDNWTSVENAWEKRGVKADWSFVEEAAEQFSIYNGDTFSSSVRNHLHEEWERTNSTAAIIVLLNIATFIPVFICGRMLKKEIVTWRTDMKKYKSHQKAIQKDIDYNKNTYPRLLTEWKKKLLEVKQRYKEENDSIQEKIAIAQKNIEENAHLLPSSYHSDANCIADILAQGRAPTVEEAIRVYEEDLERFAEEERRRKEIEEQSNREWKAFLRELRQEQDVRDAADAAERAAQKAAKEAQAKKDRDDRRAANAANKERIKRIGAAYARCENCANFRSCNIIVKNSFRDTGDVCPSYRPK